MKICIQDTLKNPEDWRAIDSADWHLQSARPLPIGEEVLDDQRGWFHKLCIQGIGLTGDHHAVKHLPDGCEVTSWSDDSEDDQDHPDWKPTDPKEWWYRAHVIRFRELAPNEKLGGAITPHTDRVLYAGKRVLEEWESNSPNGYQDMILKPWEEFVRPPLDITRHGIWVPDALQIEHEDKRSGQNWRAWGEHLNPSELDENGLVKPQYSQGRMSPPKGTLTQFLRDTARLTGIHVTMNVVNEVAMLDTAGTGETLVSGNFSAGEDDLAYCWSSDTTFPNVGDWPNGLYECQTDCSAIDGDMSYGLLTLGGSVGHFANVDSGLTTDNETWQQTQGAFTVATLNLGSNTIDPASGASSDRFECLIVGARAAGCHGNQSFTLTFDSDAFARGPWTAPTGIDIPIAMYHHMKHNLE